jgi:hypothetical protein
MAKIVVVSPSLTQPLLLYLGLRPVMLDNISGVGSIISYDTFFIVCITITIVLKYNRCIIFIGTLDGFTFDSDGEGDKLREPHASQNDQNNEDEDQPKLKTRRKAEKPAVCVLASSL